MSLTKDKIINVLINYIKSGTNLDNISIQKIANEADIGKSTVYEYFSSKESLIEETYLSLIEYYHNWLLIDIKTDFTYTLKVLIKAIIEVMKDAKIIMEAILQNPHQFSCFNERISQKVSNVHESMKAHFRKILALGEQEKIISNKYRDPKSEYIIRALLTSLSAQYVSRETYFTEIEIVDFIYDSIILYLK